MKLSIAAATLLAIAAVVFAGFAIDGDDLGVASIAVGGASALFAVVTGVFIWAGLAPEYHLRGPRPTDARGQTVAGADAQERVRWAFAAAIDRSLETNLKSTMRKSAALRCA